MCVGLCIIFVGVCVTGLPHRRWQPAGVIICNLRVTLFSLRYSNVFMYIKNPNWTLYNFTWHTQYYPHTFCTFCIFILSSRLTIKHNHLANKYASTWQMNVSVTASDVWHLAMRLSPHGRLIFRFKSVIMRIFLLTWCNFSFCLEFQGKLGNWNWNSCGNNNYFGNIPPGWIKNQYS